MCTMKANLHRCIKASISSVLKLEVGKKHKQSYSGCTES